MLSVQTDLGVLLTFSQGIIVFLALLPRRVQVYASSSFTGISSSPNVVERSTSPRPSYRIFPNTIDSTSYYCVPISPQLFPSTEPVLLVPDFLSTSDQGHLNHACSFEAALEDEKPTGVALA
ncbi:hypothetical protein BGY98DRAFT_1097335 [Russula aff. rugulosa BPL654]|nr:hypothetical protein BGY98DRAFT_1097335 [Russula aff. rugulosa BPL654]